MIKLYNHSKVQDEPIRKALTWAARMIGVPGDIYVKVTGNMYVKGKFAGLAFLGYPRVSYLQNKPRSKWTNVWCDWGNNIGFVEMAFGLQPSIAKRELNEARYFLELALHEFSHILDFRTGKHDDTPRNRAGRRIAHDKRPCELRADDRVYNTLEAKRNRERVDELVLNLALAIEEANKV